MTESYSGITRQAGQERIGQDLYEIWSGWVGESKLERLVDRQSYQGGPVTAYSLESAKKIAKARVEEYKKNPWGDKPIRVVVVEVQKKIVHEEKSGG